METWKIVPTIIHAGQQRGHRHKEQAFELSGKEVVVQSLGHVWLFATPQQASLSIIDSQSLLKLSPLSQWCHPTIILCYPFLLLPSIFTSIRVFSNESVLCIRSSKYWSFSFSISPSVNIQDWFPLGWTGWISLQSKGFSRIFPRPQFKSVRRNSRIPP